MKRYPVLTALALGLLVGVLAVVALAVGDGHDDGKPRVAVDTSVPATRRPPATQRPPATGAPGQPGVASAGSAGQSCVSRSGSRNGQSVQLDLCVRPTTVGVGRDVSFEATAAPCDGTVDFGDGEANLVKGGAGRTTFTHAYLRPGRHTVRFVAPACGGTGEIAVTVTVT